MKPLSILMRACLCGSLALSILPLQAQAPKKDPPKKDEPKPAPKPGEKPADPAKPAGDAPADSKKVIPDVDLGDPDGLGKGAYEAFAKGEWMKAAANDNGPITI